MGNYTSTRKHKHHSKYVNELKSRISALKLSNDRLNEENKKLKGEPSKQSISPEIIKKYAQEMIKDDNINIDFFPDAVERAIYENILTIVLGLMNNVLQNSEVKFLSHKLNFRLEPDSN